MSDRVLSTAAARDSITKFKQIINGPLLEQIAALDREGKILSQPDVWDGRLATNFRSDWTQVNATLIKTKNALEELRQRVQQINDDIMRSGGNI